MTDHLAKLKGHDVTTLGVTPDTAKEMYAHKGRCYMAIVEVSVDAKHDAKKKAVDLVVESFEIAQHGSAMDDHLRDIAATLYQNRGITDAQQALDDSLTPSLEDAIAAGRGHTPHPFLPVDAADDNAICDVCGVVDAENPAHAAYADRPPVADPFERSETADDYEEQPALT